MVFGVAFGEVGVEAGGVAVLRDGGAGVASGAAAGGFAAGGVAAGGVAAGGVAACGFAAVGGAGVASGTTTGGVAAGGVATGAGLVSPGGIAGGRGSGAGSVPIGFSGWLGVVAAGGLALVAAAPAGFSGGSLASVACDDPAVPKDPWQLHPSPGAQHVPLQQSPSRQRAKRQRMASIQPHPTSGATANTKIPIRNDGRKNGRISSPLWNGG